VKQSRILVGWHHCSGRTSHHLEDESMTFFRNLSGRLPQYELSPQIPNIPTRHVYAWDNYGKAGNRRPSAEWPKLTTECTQTMWLLTNKESKTEENQHKYKYCTSLNSSLAFNVCTKSNKHTGIKHPRRTVQTYITAPNCTTGPLNQSPLC
jgi:hypothetical protein